MQNYENQMFLIPFTQASLQAYTTQNSNIMPSPVQALARLLLFQLKYKIIVSF